MLRLSSACDEFCRGASVLGVRHPSAHHGTSGGTEDDPASTSELQRVASDTFFFLAADGVRWGVIHYVGDLVELQAGGLVKHSSPQ